MKYRTLTTTTADSPRDYQLNVFLKDSPECVGQAVLTRLLLWQGEWFNDTTDGTPYYQKIFGHATNYDLEVQSRILGTPNVIEILDYSSNIDSTRNLSVNCTLNTKFGTTTIQLPR